MIDTFMTMFRYSQHLVKVREGSWSHMEKVSDLKHRKGRGYFLRHASGVALGMAMLVGPPLWSTTLVQLG